MRMRKLNLDEKILIGRKLRGPHGNWSWGVFTLKEVIENNLLYYEDDVMLSVWLIDNEGNLYQWMPLWSKP